MEPSKLKTVEMVRSIRDAQYEQTKSMNTDDKIEYYRQNAQALLKQLEKLVERHRQKMTAA